MDDGPDLGEAVDFILAERPRLDEEHVWAVVNELGVPPGPEVGRLLERVEGCLSLVRGVVWD